MADKIENADDKEFICILECEWLDTSLQLFAFYHHSKVMLSKLNPSRSDVLYPMAELVRHVLLKKYHCWQYSEFTQLDAAGFKVGGLHWQSV